MPIHDLHKKQFDEATQTKLALYGDYVSSWLPVFLNTQMPVSTINIFDFFAGPGRDPNGNPGSPVIALERISGALAGKHPNTIPPIHLYLNEYDSDKFTKLSRLSLPSELTERVILHFSNRDFADLFGEWASIMEKPGAANLVFVDQNGVKQMSREVFSRLCLLPKTDFLFFLSSSFISRFREDPNFNKYLPLDQIDKAELTNANAHRMIAEGYRKWIPAERRRKYFLSHFSLKKEHSGNIHGLIFGSGSIIGIHKFLELCWEQDKVRGEANFDIDAEGIDASAPHLFPELDKPNKLQRFETGLNQAILQGVLKTNLDLVYCALLNGFLPRHAKEVVKGMVQRKELPLEKTPPISIDAWKNKKIVYLFGDPKSKET